MFINATESDLSVRRVSGLSVLEITLVKAYLQGDNWCNKRGDAELKVQYFLGDDNMSNSEKNSFIQYLICKSRKKDH